MASLRRALRSAVLASGFGARHDFRFVRRLIAGPVAPRHHVLIAPPGGGNIGDQAMVEAFLQRATAPVVIVTSARGALSVAPQFEDRVEILDLPALLYHSGREHREALAAFAGTLRGARTVSVVGADIMDGAYIPRASVRRATLARAAAARGIDTRILGFSWPAAPLPAARRALRAAAADGVAVLPRDPIGGSRLGLDGIRVTRQVSDLVFSATTVDDGLLRELGLTRPYVIVNISGHIARSSDLVSEYATVVRFLRERGLEVVILPHVFTESADDRLPSTRLHGLVAGEGVHLVDGIPTPAEVRGLAQSATLTVTGRMHLAIMSIMNGVPAVTLATQGKVEGLMDMIRSPQLCVEPGPGAAPRIISVATEALPADSDVRAAIASALPKLYELSLLNFEGLEVPVEVGAARS